MKKPKAPKKQTRNISKEQPFMKGGKPVSGKSMFNFDKSVPKTQRFAKGLTKNDSYHG